MEFVQNIGPFGIIFIMFSLGLNLTVSKFLEVVKKTKTLTVGLICQMLILPLIGIIMINFYPLRAEYQLGVFLLLILPSAVMSNYATRLVKGNVALSITLTSVCALLSFITIPLFLKIYTIFVDVEAFNLNLLKFSVRIFLFITLPTIIGILVRGNFKKFTEAYNFRFDRASFILFMLIVVVAIYTERMNLAQYFEDTGALAFLIIFLIMIIVFGITQIFVSDISNRKTIIIETMLQNGAMGFIVGAQLFDDLVYVAPIGIYALIQYVVLMFYIGNVNINKQIQN